MSDLFYNLVWYAGYPAFFTSSRPTVINARVTRRHGAFILASNHQAPYDIPLLMRHCVRRIDFVSIVEVFRNPLVAWFYGSMNAFPLDRAKPDSPTVRTILDRLSRGRVIGIFPEGRFRKGGESVVHTGEIRSGIGRIANLSGAPVVPCVIAGSPAYSRFASWLPLFRTRYGIAFGEAIDPTLEAEEIEKRLVEAMRELYTQLVGRGFVI